MNFDQFCNECLENVDGDVRAAEELARKRLSELEDGDILEQLIDFALHAKMSECMRDARYKCMSTSSAAIATSGAGALARPDDASGLRSIARREIASFYSMPLKGGRKLGDAVHADLLEQEEIHAVLAKTNGIKARWMGLIRARLPEDDSQCVRQVWTEEQLGKLHEQSVTA